MPRSHLADVYLQIISSSKIFPRFDVSSREILVHATSMHGPRLLALLASLAQGKRDLLVSGLFLNIHAECKSEGCFNVC